jgi:hypothetical protein
MTPGSFNDPVLFDERPADAVEAVGSRADNRHMGIPLRNTWPEALCKRDTGEGPVGNRTWAVPG